MDEKILAQEAREALINYYGTAAFCGMPAALVDVARAEQMSDSEAIEEAQENGLI